MVAKVGGLRERKKQLTRESIAEAALQLAVEKGLEHVTIEEIARVAFISPRTVSNYFSCKEEAIVAPGADDVLTIAGALADRPETESPMDSLRVLLVDYADSRTPDQLRTSAQTMELAEEYPSLRPFQTAQYERLEESLRDAVALRTGTDVNADIYPWLVAGAAVSAYKSALRLWTRTGAAVERLPTLIHAAYDQISDALGEPQSHHGALSPAMTAGSRAVVTMP